MAARRSILVAYFLLGAYAVCAQATLLREAQVLLFGSELSWGLVLALWLAGVAVGAQAAGRFLDRARRPWLVVVVSGLAMPPLLAAEVALLRLARPILGVGAGEYVGLGQMIAVSAVATVPVSLWIGLGFPAASAMLAREAKDAADKARAVGWIYLVESAGSLVGGALFSFVLVTHTSAPVLALGGGAVLAVGMALLARGEKGSRTLKGVRGPGPFFAPAVLAWALVQAALVGAGAASWLDGETVRWRWRSFAPGLALVESRDSRHQNIAVGRLEDQFSLYTSGTVAATWPNHRDLAVEAHLMACQHPAPRRILLLGGGTEGLVKELLRHKPERLDYVTLDRVAHEAVYRRLDAADREAADAIRDGTHFADARWFVKAATSEAKKGTGTFCAQHPSGPLGKRSPSPFSDRSAEATEIRRGEEPSAGAAGGYDLVILAAAEPASTLEARLYTLEFFEELARIMSDDGVLAFALSGSVGYWGPEASRYVGSIVRPLEGAFAEVLLTFGQPTYCFAARRKGVLADTGEALEVRYRARGIESPYFHPLWFAGASDLLDPAKRRDQMERLERHWPHFVNTDEQPAAAIYRMLLWYQTTGAAHVGETAPTREKTSLLEVLLGLRLEWVVAAVGGAVALAAGLGWTGGRRGFRRAALLWSVGTTGFASMAVEIVLLYTFQTLYGYVYGMIGMVVGVFMFGLVVGSFLMNRRLRRAQILSGGGPAPAGGHPPLPRRAQIRAGGPGLRTVLALDLAVAVFAASLVLILALLRESAAEWPVHVATFGLVAVAGVLGGLVFPLAASVSVQDRTTTGRAAGAIDAADHIGACAGALATGVALVPVLGISGTCLVVALMKALAAVQVGAASLARGQ